MLLSERPMPTSATRSPGRHREKGLSFVVHLIPWRAGLNCFLTYSYSQVKALNAATDLSGTRLTALASKKCSVS
jgi:hypothetical protein